ncbi:MAG: DUF5916 domain-containing protein [Bacteroidota bacterium]
MAFPVEAGAIRVDGVLDEPAWVSAEVGAGFVQYVPNPGAPLTEPTEARVLIGPSALYVGMRMTDSQPDGIDARLARRDAGIVTDRAIVVLDSYGDGRTGFLFMITPGGIQRDVLFFDDTEADLSWDAVWDVATTRDETGWTAEFEIPLAQLRYTSGPGPHRWGLQFVRVHFRTQEVSYWSERPPNAAGYVSQFGTLVLPSALPTPRRLEVVPYAAAALTRAPGEAADPFYEATGLAPRVGLDLKLGLTSAVTLNATLNPDFGQVEADPAQVNLSGFELFFPEQRPFFTEGTDVFSLTPRSGVNTDRPQLLYTRRIGRSPQRTAFVPTSAFDDAGDDGTVYTDVPQQSTILGAAKLSGRVGRFSVGLLNATTRAETARFAAFDASTNQVADGRALVEPLSNYLAGRTRGTFGTTVVGGFLTSVLRDTSDPDIDAAFATTATVAGLDVEQPVGDQWLLTAQTAGSATTGSASATADLQQAFPRLLQRPDAPHLGLDTTRTSLTGWTAEVNAVKIDGAHWTGGLQVAATSPGFDANALGFQRRADLASVDARATYTEPSARGLFQSWSASLLGGSGWTFGGERVGGLVSADLSGQLRSFWDLGLSAEFEPRRDDDRLTRGGPLARQDASSSLSLRLSTDARRSVVGFASGQHLRSELGRVRTAIEGGVELRPSDALVVSLEPSVVVEGDPRQYVTALADPAAQATFGTRYVFGQLDATSVALAARVDWTFMPRLSLQLFVRPFASRGQFSAFKEANRPGALRFLEYGTERGRVTENADGSTRIDPGDGGAAFTLARDFTVRSLQGNAVLRWEYRPGSAFFFVWQQQRGGFADDGRLRVGRDLRGLFTDTPTNVFLVKVSHWIG